MNHYPSASKDEPQLSTLQQDTVYRIADRALEHAKKLQAISALRSTSGCPDSEEGRRKDQDALSRLKMPRQSNCVGLFGGRGSGKTTLLIKVLDKLAEDVRGSWKVIRQPLDLSYAPREFPHGLTALHWMRETLAREVPRAESKRLQAAVERAAHSYFRGADGFNQLVRDLAISPENYAKTASREISARLRLWTDIRDCLDALAEHHQVEGFVLAIDDLDLAPVNRHQNLVWSLLDELHQDRLVFVLAGDLDRLERRLAEEDALQRRALADGKVTYCELDLQAARDLVFKALPQVDRAEQQPWPMAERIDFRVPPSETTLGGLVARELSSSVLKAHLPHLLPPWPRGLENVYRELAASPTARLNREFMAILADSNFHFDLARKLRERDPTRWASSFVWDSTSAHLPAQWRVIRGSLNQEGDLPELLPDSSPLPLGPERERWAETLIDLALDAGTLGTARLIDRLDWLARRFRECEVALARNDEVVIRACSDEPQRMRAALYWLAWSTKGRVFKPGQFTLGFWPLFEWQADRRTLFPAEWRYELSVEFGTPGSGNAPHSAESSAELVLLPRRARDLLRLADALAKQPWAALPLLRDDIHPVGFAQLAALLTYRAMHVLYRPSVDKEGVYAGLQQDLDQVARTLAEILSAEGSVLGLDNQWVDKAFESIAQVAEAELEIMNSKPADTVDPIDEVLRSFLSAPCFQGLRPVKKSPDYPG